ncbi:hypothetical protein LAZ67_6000429 [Cordylochernes scorpioides]|uniref:Helicase ATP-binding domain-containing protein n=1 Tax=Cordylochernes scorpioides TaxID=51811 RepID=A0ABY6KII8_9ARAC|nr:hypothetical protein LAZ67_6000429 [Cordylochernes scorpioides]
MVVLQHSPIIQCYWCLNKVLCVPRLLEEYSHVFLDEAHERSMETDFLLIIMKELVQQRKDLRVVLMSASMDQSKFAHYFVILILSPQLLLTLFVLWAQSTPSHVNSVLPLTLMGAILIFLPGWRDIMNLKEELEKNQPNSDHHDSKTLYHVHLDVRDGECYRLFTSARYHLMSEHIEPEICHLRLEVLCLRIKNLKLGSIIPFLEKALSVPPLENVKSSIHFLQTLVASSVVHRAVVLKQGAGFIHRKSSVCQAGQTARCWAVFYQSMKQNEIVLHDITYINPLAMILFSKDLEVRQNVDKVTLVVDGWAEVQAGLRTAALLQGYGGAASVLMLESAAKASASMLGTASNYRQSQTFTKVCLDHGAMINESCTPTPHSMRSDVDLHAASPVAQNKQGRVQDLASKQLRILQCNINGLCSTATKIKLEEIMEIAEKQKIQIIALQETKLNEKYNLKYKNYNILRKDRNKEGGGLAFLIKNLYYEDIAINIPNTSDLEAQGIKVYLSQNKTINIFNMYHPPNNKLIDDGTMAQFLTDNTIIVGDLNAKHQLWGCSMPNPRGKILSNLFDDNAFMCLNDGNPTHHSYSYNTAQALDISFSSPDIFNKCKWQILKSIGSDHLPILIEISTKTKTSSIKEKFWNFKKANWNLYQQNTNEDFRKAPTRIKDLEQNWISFKNTIIKAAKVSIPRGNIKKWIPNYTHQAKDIQTLITKRNELQKKCTQNQTNCRTELNIVNAKIKSTHNIFHEKINMKELDYALENTDLNKTPGPDGIHGQMISNLGKNGKERLLDIFNNSWKTGKLPQDWKTATIIPIKKLDKSADDPKNYRPISLTSICCKLMEKIILRRLTYHLDTKNLLPEEQYGFRKAHGTIDQLLFFTQKTYPGIWISNLWYSI